MRGVADGAKNDSPTFIRAKGYLPFLTGIPLSIVSCASFISSAIMRHHPAALQDLFLLCIILLDIAAASAHTFEHGIHN